MMDAYACICREYRSSIVCPMLIHSSITVWRVLRVRICACSCFVAQYEFFSQCSIVLLLTWNVTYLQYVSVEMCIRKCKVCCRGYWLSVFRSRYGTWTWSLGRWRCIRYTTTCAADSAPSTRMTASLTDSSAAGTETTRIHTSQKSLFSPSLSLSLPLSLSLSLSQYIEWWIRKRGCLCTLSGHYVHTVQLAVC